MERYSLKKCEQEVVINFNAEDDFATVYSSSPVWIRKLNKLCASNPKDYKLIDTQTADDGMLISHTWTCPKSFITLKAKKRTMSEEQRKASADRLRALRQG